MDVNFYKKKMQNLTIDGDKKYLSFQFSFETFDITPLKVFQYFSNHKGERYWYRSKGSAPHYDKLGIKYIHAIRKDKFSAKELLKEKQELFSCIQYVNFDQPNSSQLSLFGGLKFSQIEKTDEWKDFSYIGFLLAKYQFDFTHNIFHVTEKIESIDFETIIEDIERIFNEISNISDFTYEYPVVAKHKDLFVKGWKKLVAKTIQKLNDDFRKVVLSRQKLIMFNKDVDPNFIVHQLKGDTEDFTLVFERHDAIFVSKTPERLFKIKDNIIHTSAVAGSAKKTGDVNIDNDTKQRLLEDEKNIFEHEVVTSDIKEGLLAFSESIEVPNHPSILENRYIFHLETPIKATLKADVNLFSILHTLHPTAAMGGIPKDKAEQYITKKEFGTRGLYAAPIGLIHESNDSEFLVAIRSMFLSDGSATLYAGCGIVKDSNVEDEFEETNVKFKPMLELLGVEDES